MDDSDRAVGQQSRFKADLLASMVAFLVALPLCMGIAIASGVPVAAGLITGMVGGLVVGSLAGSPLQVSGPAAGLTVIVFDLVQRFGLPVLGTIVLLAGAIQLAAGLLRLGQWFRAVSPAVIQGMLAGIGVLIFASQFHVMVDDAPKGTGLQNLLTIPEAVRKGLPMPQVRSAEERQFLATKLKEIGHLHEQQAAIQEHVEEQIPVAPELSEQDGIGEGLAPLEVRQAAISADLAQLVTELDAWLQSHPGPKLNQMHQAAATALAKSQVARDDLLEHHVAGVRESQREATTALEGLLGTLKNHDWAAKIGLLTIVTIVLWQSFAPMRLKLLPGPLLAVVLVTGLCAVLNLPVLYVEVPDNLWEGVHVPSPTALQDVSWLALLQAAGVIAAVASAETLLCATAVDQLHNGPRTRYDRELSAQGIGNMLCGFLGALPMTGVIVRSATNVNAGAKTRLSAILHGLWLFVFVVGLGTILRMIPTASLAGILVYTGYKLVNPKSIRELWKHGKGEVFIYAMTLTFIVTTDLLTGVLVGIGLSAIKLLLTVSMLRTYLVVSNNQREAMLHLEGAATFLKLPKLAAELERVPRGCRFTLDHQRLQYLDHACLDLLLNWAKQHEAGGGVVAIDWETLPVRVRRSSTGETQWAAPAAEAGRVYPAMESDKIAS